FVGRASSMRPSSMSPRMHRVSREHQVFWGRPFGQEALPDRNISFQAYRFVSTRLEQLTLFNPSVVGAEDGPEGAARRRPAKPLEGEKGVPTTARRSVTEGHRSGERGPAAPQ